MSAILSGQSRDPQGPGSGTPGVTGGNSFVTLFVGKLKSCCPFGCLMGFQRFVANKGLSFFSWWFKGRLQIILFRFGLTTESDS